MVADTTLKAPIIGPTIVADATPDTEIPNIIPIAIILRPPPE